MNSKVIYQNLPCDIDGYTVANLDDNGEPFYTIVLNTRLSDERQRLACYHEQLHILEADFDKAKEVGVDEVEKEVRKSKYEFAI
ncbi:hypothetical protein [Senimuribacter intestinalis]|uniref:hypothetical protein n=1 Tax=Senimuribacter intestinalis TaxID=2941507 RepID=UPI00203D8D4E|nr:hypothetical protein [Senimuribacter intestinalis]